MMKRGILAAAGLLRTAGARLRRPGPERRAPTRPAPEAGGP